MVEQAIVVIQVWGRIASWSHGAQVSGEQLGGAMLGTEHEADRPGATEASRPGRFAFPLQHAGVPPVLKR